MEQKVSPLQAKPIRQPGQSVQEEMNELGDGLITI
jgi:hypothetical protein